MTELRMAEEPPPDDFPADMPDTRLCLTDEHAEAVWAEAKARMDRETARRIETLEKLLREGVKIVHCHARNTDKDWLARARAALRQVKIR